MICGFALKFQVTKRRELDMPGEVVNSPGSPPQRGPNKIGVWEDMPAKPRTFSHIVCFVPDIPAAEAFYVKRLGFKVTDRFNGTGPFLRPAGTQDHHTLFFIQTPVYMKGCEHFAFHMGGPTELMLAGTRFIKAGYQSVWGPGRHKFGSNWFWYFNSPLGCHVEYDADMDQHDDEWAPRETPISPEAAQAFLFEFRERWAPGGPPPRSERRGALNGVFAGSTTCGKVRRARLDHSTTRAPRPSWFARPAASTPGGTPARTMAERRWRGERTPI